MPMNTSSIEIAKHKNVAFYKDIEDILIENLGFNEVELRDMSVEDYREIVLHIQNILNSMEVGRQIVQNIQKDLEEYLKTDEILIQSNIYLRASRPTQMSGQENIGWHRETFYGANMANAVNVWTPIRGVNKNNTLQFIPESHLIPEESIIVKKDRDLFTDKFSTGHKLGFQYEPKTIVGGVDFSKKERMIVPNGCSAIFNGNLIHGAADNMSSNIRFSTDFRVIRKKDYSSENKQFHYSSGKPYFIEY